MALPPRKRRLAFVRGSIVVMAFRRFYLAKDEMGDEGALQIRGELFHHIRDVCRFGEGDKFEILPGDGRAILYEISAASKKEFTAAKVSERTLPPLHKPLITLALSVPKLPKVDWIVEKCVELGVFEIRPFVSDFSFLRKVSEISPSRISRWEKLAQAATQQTGRGDVLAVRPAVTLAGLLNEFNQNPNAAGLFPYEGEAQLRLPDAIREVKAKKPENLWLFVGSEGGFSPREVQIFSDNGLKPVSMGTQILRVETACLALVSIIKYEAGALS